MTHPVNQLLADRVETIGRFAQSEGPRIHRIAVSLALAIRSGHKVLACGNGGSCSDAQHLVGEIVGRFKIEREGIPAVAIGTNPAVLTSIANDYGYEAAFAREVEAIGRYGDVLVAYSTSGRSSNVLRAIAAAKRRRMKIVLLTGQAPDLDQEVADITLRVPSTDTPLIQECHAIANHIVVQVVEMILFEGEGGLA